MTEDLSKLVFKDELTDLYNRRFLYSYLKEQIKLDDPKCCVSLMMIDIDFFKQVNDTYGHLEGDNILKQLAQVIRDTFTSKIKGLTEAHNIRYAGDEFTVVLPNIDKSKAVTAAEKLRQAIAATPFKRREAGQEPLSLKVSIGIASAPGDAKTPDELIDQADKALYFSKQNGRNKVAAAGSFSEASILEKTLFNTFPCPTFVGQEALFTEMVGHIRAMTEGQNFFYLVEGPTGYGKTRLLRELEKSGGSDYLALLTVCDETDKFTPYKSITNLLKRLELPTPVDQPVSNSEEDRKSLFDSITNQLTKLSQTKPLLIMLDEFQYADDGTMEVINFFAENAQGRIIMIFAVRDEILAKAAIFYPRLDNFMADMSVSSNFKRLTVTPFDQQYTSMMVAGILPGHPVIPGFTQKIYETSKGNPLFIEELLKNFILKKHIQKKEAGWQIDINNIKEADWQRDVNELINENVSLLEAGTREIVRRATVVGRELDVAVLAGVAHQNETETMEMLDKAKQMHIIEPVDPSKSDKFAFVNKRAQEVIYQNIEEKERQNLHYEAGEITRKIHKDDLEKVAGALAVHYDKGGDEKKAEQFGKLAETEANKYFRPDEANNYFDHKRSIIRSKIKEAVQPLNSDQLNIMKDVLRGLLTTAKNMKLYPDGSQLITFSTGGLIKSMNNIFAQIESITLSEAKGELNINTAPVDIKAFGTAPAEFSAMMKDHYIKSCTIRRGVTEKEIEQVLSNLDNSPDKPYSVAGYWNKFVEDNGITNIGIAQRAFVAVREKPTAAAGPQTKIQIDDSNAPLFRDLLRYFIAAVENIRLYPVGSQLTTDAVNSVNKALQNVFKTLPNINFSSVEDMLLINGTPAPAKTLGTAATTLARYIKNNELKSISINNTASQQELERFFTLMSNLSSAAAGGTAKTTDEWDTVLGNQAISNIRIGDIAYSMADARRGVYKPAATPTVLGGEPEAVPQYAQSAIMRREELTVRKAENLPAQVDKFLNGLPDRLMTDEFISLIDKLVEIKADANIKKLTAKFMENFRSSQPKIRTQANTFYTQLLNKAKVPARPVIMNEALTVLVEGIRTEQDGKIYTLLIESLLRNALFYLETSNYEELLKPISAINNRLEGKMLTTTEMTQKSEFFFHELKQSPAFQTVLANLKSKDLHLHNLSRQILNGLGILAVPELLKFIKDTEETSFREEMLGFINSHGRAAQEFFLRELTKSDEDGEIRPLQRLIEIAPLVPLHEVETSLMGFLKHRNAAVRDSALKAVRRFSKDSALKILLPLIDGKDKGLAVSAVETVADLGYKEAIAEIVNLLETSRDDSIRKKCCLALGKLKDENTVPVLTGLLFKKKFLGLFGGVADEVRSSAVWALGQFRTPEAIESLKLALNDKSPLVRSAAKIGLKENK